MVNKRKQTFFALLAIMSLTILYIVLLYILFIDPYKDSIYSASNHSFKKMLTETRQNALLLFCSFVQWKSRML